ncbi:10969_t:CDS:1 [Racocetra persica]|uniref:10969_t:CDS:1 n=1 Tax=Racocetra persica TaxID=160502 RepID=A0ACA9RYA3_9GLOM|nr:10969_t:CDS:1 [Racocetra persica]
MGHVLDKSFSSEDACRMLPALEMLISSVNCRIYSETSIKDYITQKINLSTLTENAEFCGMFSTELRLKHLISLYERVESMKTYSFDDIDNKYKKSLSQHMEMRLLRVIDFDEQFHNQISSCELLIALERFLVRYLMVESSEYIATENKLADYINDENFSCWPSISSLEFAKKIVSI